MPEVTFESLAKDIKDTKSLVASFVADHDEDDKKTEEAKKAKKAQDEKDEDEKKEAKRASRIAAIKKAMEEPTDEKKDAAIKKAMDDDHPKDHTANDEDDKEKEASDEEKEKEAQIASIISDKRQEIISKILQANTIVNPNNLKEIDTRLKKASITEIKKEWEIVKSFVGNVDTTQQAPQEKFVPFFANITPQDIDSSSLTASSPESDFAKFTTKELLEMTQ